MRESDRLEEGGGERTENGAKTPREKGKGDVVRETEIGAKRGEIGVFLWFDI